MMDALLSPSTFLESGSASARTTILTCATSDRDVAACTACFIQTCMRKADGLTWPVSMGNSSVCRSMLQCHTPSSEEFRYRRGEASGLLLLRPVVESDVQPLLSKSKSKSAKSGKGEACNSIRPALVSPADDPVFRGVAEVKKLLLVIVTEMDTGIATKMDTGIDI